VTLMEPYLFNRCVSEITDEKGRWLLDQFRSKYPGLQNVMVEVSNELRELDQLRQEVPELRKKLEDAEFWNEIHKKNWDDEHNMTTGEWEKEVQIQELRAELAEEKHVKVSTRQRSRIIWIATAIAVVMGLFPPWLVTYAGGIARPMGYGPIFDPPQPQYGGIHLDIVRLIVQWATLMFVAVGLSWTTGHTETAADVLLRVIGKMLGLLRRFVACAGVFIFWVPICGMAVVLGIAHYQHKESVSTAYTRNVRTILTDEGLAGPGMPAEFSLSEFTVEQLSHDWTFFLGGDVRYRISALVEIPKLTAKDFADYFYLAVENSQAQYNLDRQYFQRLRAMYPGGLKDPELVQRYLRNFPSSLAAFRLWGGGSLTVAYVLKHSQPAGHPLSVPGSTDWQTEDQEATDRRDGAVVDLAAQMCEESKVDPLGILARKRAISSPK
jgi:hypothetical protein